MTQKVSCTQISLSGILSTGNGCGSSATSRLPTGKSTFHPFYYNLFNLKLTKSSGAPKSSPTIVSRLVTASYWQRQCELYFPKTNHRAYGSSPDHHPPYTVDHPNSWTKGWDTPKKATPSTRVMWANGEFDPWKTSGISSEYRTGGPWQSTENAPVQVIPGGFHCSDLILKNGLSNAGVQKVIDAEVALMKTWVAEFYTEKLKV
jgi:hypothetical protein